MSTGKAIRGQAILVVGMHRSGTSALTRVLNLLGVELGNHLLPPGKGNQHGHWEHQDVVTIHEKLLHDLGMSWDETRAMPDGWVTSESAREARQQLVVLLGRDFSDTPLWAVKDPRVCRLLPLWKLVLDELGVEASVVFAVRNPAEVVGSLHARDGLDRASMRLSWFEHMAEAEAATRSWRRTVVAYDELLSNWRKSIANVEARLQLHWSNAVVDVAADIDAFLDSGLRHNHADLTGDPREPADELYTCLAACTHDDQAWAAASELVDDYQRWAPTFLHDIEGRHKRFERLDTRLKQTETENAGHVEVIRDQERKLYGLFETVHGKDIHIQNRDAIIESKDAQIQNRDAIIENKDVQIQNRDTIIEKKDLDIEQRDSVISARDARITAILEALDSHEKRNAELAGNYLRAVNQADDLQARLDLIERSRSWRLTAPLRALNRESGPLKRIGKAVIYAFGHPFRYLRLARQLGLGGSMVAAKQFMARGGPRPIIDPVPVHAFDIRSRQGQPVGILTTHHCLFIAELIADALKRLDISSEILFERPRKGFRDVPHFVICPQMFEELPGLYVAFQMEQSVSSRWFTGEYLRMLENSFAILDYSTTNIKKLTDMGLSPRQFFYLPVGPLLGYGQASSEAHADHGYEYDVIFYGDVNNARRQAFLAALEKVCKVKVVGNLFGTKLHKVLRKAKLVVNIHYYEGALLETTRLWECLSLGKFVISERSSDMHEHEELTGLVDFVDVGDMNGMVERVHYWLNAIDELDSRVQVNDEAIRSSFSKFDYFFYRFMLYSGNISFQEFWELVGDKLPAPGEKLCLNLPEYVNRAEDFDKDNRYGFTRFSGLKHPYGWMGCAMSYKFMAMWAKKYHFSQLIVCEDDVEFPVDFDMAWSTLSRYLEKTRNDWDLFSGILADLHEDAEILDSRTEDGKTYVTLDKMISTVYNVYNPKALDFLADWDDKNDDVETNTIDRYLERCADLRVVTTLPFLVGHKEELYSTLWGTQNTEYTALIEASQELLKQKVEQWHLPSDAQA